MYFPLTHVKMPLAAISLPSLSVLLQQLAGILPLSAFIEFIDIATKVHLFKLNGSVALWNWPVTPPGARLLLSYIHSQNQRSPATFRPPGTLAITAYPPTSSIF
jgi:hypothetical protein